MDLPPHRDLGERVRAALARRGAGALHEADGEEGGCRVRAFLAGPDESTNTTRNTFLFVGGRFVRDRNLLHALALGYGPLLEKGRYPMAALFLDVPGADVDVNVHPQKLEVRFARAQEVYAAVRHVVGAAIARAPWLRDRRTTARCGRSPSRRAARPPGAAGARPVRVGAGALALPRAAQSALPLRARDADDAGAGATTALDARARPGRRQRFFADLNYVGQVHRTYLVCEAADELILIDQHAAHERVAYARLRAAHARRQMPRQQLLFPIPIEVGEAAAAALETDDVLGGLGFEVARQGPGAILLRAVPEPLKDADPKPLIRELLSDLADGTPLRDGELDRVDHLLATIACHSVVRAGDVLGRPEALALLGQLDARRSPLALPARTPGAAAPAAGRDRETLRPCLMTSDAAAVRRGAGADGVGEERARRWRSPSARAARSSPATRSRCTSAWTSAPPSRPPTSGAACRTTRWTWSAPTSRSTPRAGPRSRAPRSPTSPRAAGCRSSSAGPASTTARWSPACSRRRRPTRASARATAPQAAADGVEALHARLAAVDPEAAAAIRARDLVRISRALEIYEQTGVPITTLRRRAAPPADLAPTVLLFDPPLAALRARIAARVEQMIAAGFLDEVRALRAAGYGPALKPLQALGYRQLGAVLDGTASLADAVAETIAGDVRLRAPAAHLVPQAGGGPPLREPSPGSRTRSPLAGGA